MASNKHIEGQEQDYDKWLRESFKEEEVEENGDSKDGIVIKAEDVKNGNEYYKKVW